MIAKYGALFLMFLKTFYWLAEDRDDYMDIYSDERNISSHFYQA